jgi:hypothetical protein
MTRPAREAYVRATLEVQDATLGPLEIITGIEMRDDLDFEWLRDSAKLLMRHVAEATARIADITRGKVAPTVPGIAADVEFQIKRYFPDRAYFIEVCGGTERDGWVQIYQPWTKEAP